MKLDSDLNTLIDSVRIRRTNVLGLDIAKLNSNTLMTIWSENAGYI